MSTPSKVQAIQLVTCPRATQCYIKNHTFRPVCKVYTLPIDEF